MLFLLNGKLGLWLVLLKLGVERKRQGSTVTFGSRRSKQSYILAYTPDPKRENLTLYN